MRGVKYLDNKKRIGKEGNGERRKKGDGDENKDDGEENNK